MKPKSEAADTAKFVEDTTMTGWHVDKVVSSTPIQAAETPSA